MPSSPKAAFQSNSNADQLGRNAGPDDNYLNRISKYIPPDVIAGFTGIQGLLNGGALNVPKTEASATTG